MGFNTNDIEIALSSFIGVMVAEALVKPVALRIGRYVLRVMDQRVKFLPNWLYDSNKPDK